MNWLHYLVEANIYLSVFYLCYCLFLNRETHYTLNRMYLLFSCVISFVLPLLQIGILKPVEAVVQTQAAVLPANIVYDTSPVQITAVQSTPFAEASHFTFDDGILYTYLLGVGILMILLVIKLYKLAMLRRANSIINDDGYKLIYIEESNTAFSFFNYLFLGAKAPGAATIIKHELVHINQKHSADILFLELFKIVNWFNPLIYLLQNSLKTVHEYIADEQTAINEGDAISYSSFLVDNAYGISGSSITHSFFNYNLLKKRIIMLNRQRSGNLARLKYLIALPVCAALLCASTLGFSKTYGWVDLAPAHETKTTTRVSDKLSHDTTFLANLKPYVNKKGLLIDEKYYAVNGKKYFRTIISARNGKYLPNNSNESPRKKITLYLGKGNASGEEMLFDDYDYKFPNVDVTVKKNPPLHIPLPMIESKNGHYDQMAITRNKLSQYAADHIVYPKAAIKNEITGTVIAKFTVDVNHKIKDIKIVKGLGFGCDEQVINALKSYPTAINGKYPDYLVAITFDLFSRTKDYTIKRHQVDRKIYDEPNFMFAIGLTDYGPDTRSIGSMPSPPPPVPPAGKPVPPKPVVTQIKFPPPVVKPDKAPMPPKPKVDQVKFPPPIVITDSEKRSLEKFCASLQRSIHYPAVDRENKITGKVFVSFTVNPDNKIDLVKALRGPSFTLEDEVVSALKRVGSAPGAQPGITYTVPVSFNLSNTDGSYVADKPYVAETPGKTVVNTLKMPNIRFELSEIVVIGYLQ